MSAPGSASQQSSSKPVGARNIEVRLNWELPAWLPSIRENLSSLFQQEATSPALGFRPGVFWKDVFVDQQLNWKALTRSYAAHLIFAGIVYVLSMPFYAHRFTVVENFNHDQITYLNPEDDILPSEPLKEEAAPKKLAPVISRSSKGARARKSEATKRSVEAIAIPKWADNSTHVIVTPDAPKILASAPIPDIVLATPVHQAPPVAALTSAAPKLVAPVLEVTPIAPPPDVSQVRSAAAALPQPAPIAPPVQINSARNLATINIAPLPEAVNAEPKLTLQASRTIPNLGPVDPVAPPPDLSQAANAQFAKALPAPAQPVAPPPDVKSVSTSGSAATIIPGAEPVAPPPEISGSGDAPSAAGALISLNLNPVAGPVRLADGSRRGAFAGNPDASERASGKPALQAGGTGPGGDSPVATKEELGIVAAAVPHGIAGGISITSHGTASGISPNSLFTMSRPGLSLPPPRTAKVEDAPSAVDERVFRGRKYYTMALNRPNLTSAGGSWIFRFAEIGVAPKGGEVTAPVPLREVDAAYPADLIRDNVQGVVILYAVIRADGTVAEVKVLEGFDDRLDENARRALSSWHFVPGTRDGNPVDLEAVVRIPFRTKRGF
jgi:TonB family protein